ncbi:MAG TPA: GNAT family N-acetyltransferase [Burkholderiales bacterium]|nr:GNAT family N-acetyltransferase [Burkholderiales bacterium]
MTIEVVHTLTGIDSGEWNRLAGDDPFLRHEFLTALHETGCASKATGWAPHYLVTRKGGALAAAMPLYVKDHSYGEYVFDWAWADAYYRHGLEYYPKLVCAVPFTPVTGPRVLAANARDHARLIAAALQLARELDVSSLHCLFPPRDEAQQMAAHGMLLRRTVQFHWANRDYASFDDFLAGMSHDKRKKIRQERRKVREAGIQFRWLEGDAIGKEDWNFFTRCYRHTYREHQSTPYLNLEFFLRIGRAMPENLVLIVAYREGRPIAASLNLRNASRLYGRYWGTLEYHSGLHFDTCYYQGIEYCIARGMAAFEGGSRGEHKLARGLLPIETLSAHWLAHPQFSAAIENYLEREAGSIAHYVDELNERRPFKCG